jgi:hypothetical protein
MNFPQVNWDVVWNCLAKGAANAIQQMNVKRAAQVIFIAK